MKEKYIKMYMDVAQVISQQSSAVKLQVGAVIVKNDLMIPGYNGTPSGWDNVCEDPEWCSAGGWLSPDEIEEIWPYEGTYNDAEGNLMKGRYKLVTRPETLHAESNAITKLAKSTISGDGAVMFCTHSPCIECAKLIYQSGISTVYYRETYRSLDGVNFLIKCGVKVEQVV